MNKPKIPANRMEDAQLLLRFVGERDEVAFAQLLRKYERLVWIVCCRILDNRCDAEDAFQSTFVLLATKASRIRKPRSLASWLYGVAYRTARSIRRQRHRDAVPFTETVDPSLGNEVLEQVARKNENELVCAELLMIAEKYKTPMVMFYFLDLSTPQIADSLGLTVAAVESRLKRGRGALKARLVTKGINSESFAACVFVLPTFALLDSVVRQTVSVCLSASVNHGWMTNLSNGYETMNRTGVKLMILKSSIAVGLVGMLGVGIAMHSGAFAGSKEPLVLAAVDVDQPAKATPIVVANDENVHESHLHVIHNFIGAHVHWLFGKFHGDSRRELERSSATELHHQMKQHHHALELHHHHHHQTSESDHK